MATTTPGTPKGQPHPAGGITAPPPPPPSPQPPLPPPPSPFPTPAHTHTHTCPRTRTLMRACPRPHLPSMAPVARSVLSGPDRAVVLRAHVVAVKARLAVRPHRPHRPPPAAAAAAAALLLRRSDVHRGRIVQPLSTDARMGYSWYSHGVIWARMRYSGYAWGALGTHIWVPLVYMGHWGTRVRVGTLVRMAGSGYLCGPKHSLVRDDQVHDNKDRDQARTSVPPE
jgi:hypothetical protein